MRKPWLVALCSAGTIALSVGITIVAIGGVPAAASISQGMRQELSRGASISQSASSIELARVTNIPGEPACTSPVPCTWEYYAAPVGTTVAGSVNSKVQMLAPIGSIEVEDLSAQLTSPAPDDEFYVMVMDQVGHGNQHWLTCEISKGTMCSAVSTGTLVGRSVFSIAIMEESGNYAIPPEDVMVTYRLVTT